MRTSPSGAYPRIPSSTPFFDVILLALLSGSASTSPSVLPRMLVPYQPSTASARIGNIGASAVLSSVSPVLPSRPASGTSAARASSATAGSDAPADGVKFACGQPASIAASAYRHDDGMRGSSASTARRSAAASHSISVAAG